MLVFQSTWLHIIYNGFFLYWMFTGDVYLQTLSVIRFMINIIDFWITFGWLCFTSHRQRGHIETAPHLLSLAKDVEFLSLPQYVPTNVKLAIACATSLSCMQYIRFL